MYRSYSTMVLLCDSVLVLVHSHMVCETILCTLYIPPLVFAHSLAVGTHSTLGLVRSARSVAPFSPPLYTGTW